MKTQIVLIFAAAIILANSSSINSAKSLAVTIYNDDFAIVKDVRQITFDQGNSDLYFTDVSSNIQSETVTFKAIKDTENIRIFEQNFQANLINTNSILQKYIGLNLEIYVKLGETSKRVNGTLLGYNSGYIMQTVYGIEVLNNVEGISFPSLPEGFFTVPTLNWKVNSLNAITTDCEVAYRTTGFSWKADYSVVLSGDEVNADFGGWVTIDNNSGKKYENAKLKLLAGEVNTVKPAQNQNSMLKRAPMAMSMINDVADAPTFSQKSFSDFHLYTLSQQVTLNESSQKQVQFIPKVYNITVRKYNSISISTGGYSETKLTASNQIQIRNIKENQLGIPLPKGTVRVFKVDDADDSLEFIGQDSIQHTPKDQNITVTTGNAFDITADKYAKNYQNFGNGAYTADLNLTISNHKEVSCQIVVQLNKYQGDNLKITWATQGLDIETVSASLWKIKRIYQPNETFSLLWNQNYRP